MWHSILRTLGPTQRTLFPFCSSTSTIPILAREACLKALGRCEPDMALSLIRSVKYRSGPGRAGAAASLGFLKQRPEESIAILIEATRDPEPNVRETAISALSDFGPRASNAVPVLLHACNDTNKIVRRAATNALAQIAPDRQSH